jgi:hypothetical protein
VDTSNTLLPLAAGRAAFGGVAVLGAVPLCRVAEITTEPGAARWLGVAIAGVDSVSVLAAVVARSPANRRRVAVVNATTDMIMAGALVAFVMKRTGVARLVNGLAAASVFGGACAWANAAKRIRP